MKRKTLWILTALVLAALFSCGGKSAFDAFAVPAEASLWDFFKSKTEKVVELSTAADLEKLRENPEGKFALTGDITVNGATFAPIENFNGTLDGKGYWIKGICPQVGSNVVTGLFDSLGKNATVHSLGVEVTVQMNQALPAHISGMVRSNQGTILACYVLSNIVYNGGYASTAMEQGIYAPVANYNSGKIQDCTVDTYGTGFGGVYGIVEENEGSISGCKVNLDLENCQTVTGLAYRNWGEADGCEVLVSAVSPQSFCCVASQNYGPVTNCTFTGGLHVTPGGTVSQDDCYPGMDQNFDRTNTVQVQVLDGGVDTGGFGSGTVWDPYLLRSPADLERLRTEPEAVYSLERDMDFGGSVFTPIASFGGILEGNGHVIRGLTYAFSSGESSAAALFRNVTKSAVIENLTLECAMNAGTLDRADGAGITVCNEGAIRNCTVTVYADNCYAVGGITRNNTASGVISGCTVYLSAGECRFVGGVAEYQSGTVSDCAAILQVTNATSMGGIAYANAGTILNCSASGSLRTKYTNGILASLVGESLTGGTTTASRGDISNEVTGAWLPSIGNQ